MVSLREATGEKHKVAEGMTFNQRMVKGELSKEEYLLYLTQQYYIFQELENTSNVNKFLLRLENVKQDIEELGTIDKILKSTALYVNYLSNLNSDSIQPHIYLNYLALAYGGQMIKQKIHGSGKMYEFEDKQEAINSIRKIQKDEWANEVNIGFDYLINIYDELQNGIR